MRSMPLLAGACAVLLSASCTAPPKSLAGESGFVEAYFDASALNSLMADASCTHVRFYNARRVASDTKGTCIAIAVKSTGEPIYNGTSLKYRMHDRITSATTPMTLLTVQEAKDRINFVKNAGEKSYAANFKKADIQGMLAAAGCTGIKLTPERQTSGYYTMRMHPASFSGTSGQANPAPPAIITTEPCPNYCGDVPTYYIHN
ncbi:MAG: hypothetical protein IPL52_07945 [Flavobacteriales bacterium]|nr:hypothetical protein [Flavobacteriales bacterium]